ncbi:MAG: hypothetical protein ACRDOK_18815 [Streptosporangiaceae bacterium]
MNTPLVFLGLVGATLIVVRGSIARPLRTVWPAFFGCTQCVGFWIGFAGGSGGLVSTGHAHIANAIVVGSATSFLAMLSDGVLLKLLGDPSENG